MPNNKLVAETNFFTNEFQILNGINSWIDVAFNTVASAQGLRQKPHGEVGLLLTTDAEIQKLNLQFRQQDKPTNVLSFPAEADEFAAPFVNNGDLPYLGDIAMSYQTLKREAKAHNKPIENHFIHLLIHSILHLLGYDHIDNADATHMETLEIQLLATIDIENPYS